MRLWLGLESGVGLVLGLGVGLGLGLASVGVPSEHQRGHGSSGLEGSHPPQRVGKSVSPYEAAAMAKATPPG